jgi:hypothetical protein
MKAPPLIINKASFSKLIEECGVLLYLISVPYFRSKKRAPITICTHQESFESNSQFSQISRMQKTGCSAQQALVFNGE